MLTTFSAAFSGTLIAVLDIALVIGVAGVLVRKKVITQEHITSLSAVTVVVFLPCLIFANVVKNFDPGALPFWWTIPLAGAAMPLVGLGLGALVLMRELPEKRNLLPLASMQNAGYLVLPIGLKLFPDRFDTFALYCFLFILGYNPLLWSIGRLLTAADDGRIGIRRALLTPPLVANAMGILCVLLGVDAWIPKVALEAVELLGQAAIPVATFILGAVLGSIRLQLRTSWWDAVRTSAIKLMALPLITMAVVWMAGLDRSEPLLARFFVIEAAAAPATAIILQVRTYGGDEQKIGTVMLLSYLACTVTLPLWMALWGVVSSGVP